MASIRLRSSIQTRPEVDPRTNTAVMKEVLTIAGPTVDFAAQSTAGNYSLTVGRHISDLAGNDMNQDGDGTNGEDPADR